jgi:hypothetical protein
MKVHLASGDYGQLSFLTNSYDLRLTNSFEDCRTNEMRRKNSKVT